MAEDVNVRIMKKIKESDYDENVKEFLVKAIREEFQRYELHHWSYKETYDFMISNYSKNYKMNKK